MARPRRAAGIRGPISALTSFLQDNNISAAQIRETAAERRRLAAEQRAADVAAEAAAAAADAPVEISESESEASEVDPFHDSEFSEAGPSNQDTKGKGKAVAKGKGKAVIKGRGKTAPKGTVKAKKNENGKGKRKRGLDDSTDEDGDDDEGDFSDQDSIADIARTPRKRGGPADQHEKCEVCSAVFTVTPYSKAGPQGGLLCEDCSKKKIASGRNNRAIKRRAANNLRKQRKDIMDRTLISGIKPLSIMCLEVFVKHMHLAETLENLPNHLIDKVSRMTAKRRLLTPHTLPLFVRPTTRVLYIYDAARLRADDFAKCITTCTQMEEFLVRNAIQFKDDMMQLLVERPAPLKSISVHGANLLSDAAWESFFMAKGAGLKSFVIEYTDATFGDDMMDILVRECPHLTHVSIRHNPQITNRGVLALAGLKNLNSISLELMNNIDPASYVSLIRTIGGSLQTLSIRNIGTVEDDEILEAIHSSCLQLYKLRLTEVSGFTDAAMASMFTNWSNHALHHIDLFRCRAIENMTDDDGGSITGAVGPLAFRAIVQHSSHQLQHLNLVGARHITRNAFQEGFTEEGGFPKLRFAELSFCAGLHNEEVELLVAAAPRLEQVVVFGCLYLTEGLEVPKRVHAVGMSNMRTKMGMW